MVHANLVKKKWLETFPSARMNSKLKLATPRKACLFMKIRMSHLAKRKIRAVLLTRDHPGHMNDDLTDWTLLLLIHAGRLAG